MCILYLLRFKYVTVYMCAVCSETIKDNNNNHPDTRGGSYLSVTTCPFSHTADRKIASLALVVMETLNMFWFALDAPCLGPYNKTNVWKKERLDINTTSRQQTKQALRSGVAAAAVVEIQLLHQCGCLKMHRIM